MTVWLYTIGSVLAVSLLSLVGVFTLSLDRKKLDKVLIYLVGLSTGTLLGDAFIHLIPEAFATTKNTLVISLSILFGIFAFFVLEKFVHWRHCHKMPSEHHPHPFSYVILVGDAMHNFIDGLIIAASFSVSIPLGIATSLAIILHEIPHEIGNFGSLVYGGFSRGRALLFNFLTALAAILGALIVLLVNTDFTDINKFLVPFAAGGFIYVASSDLIPELHKNTEAKKSLLQIATFVAGIGLMLILLKLG